MKNTVIQCITALICVIALSVTGMSCVNKVADAAIKAADKKAEIIKNSTVAVADTSASEAPASSDSSAPADAAPADSTTDTPDDSAAPADSTAAEAPADNASSAPSSKADILKVYNDAINQAISSKASYAKKRHTELTKVDGAEAIMKIEVARDAVYGFLGVGDNDYANKKGEAKYLSKAALTEADVVDAKCTESNGVYVITLKLADGTSQANDSTKVDNSSLKRSGLFVGSDDNSDYDYKSAVNIYEGLKAADGADIKAVDEKTSNAVITMKVDANTGKISSVNASWDWSADLTKVKYIISLNATGYAKTTVAISNFQY